MDNLVEIVSKDSEEITCPICQATIEVGENDFFDNQIEKYVCFLHTRSCDNCADIYNVEDDELYYSAYVCFDCQDSFSTCCRCDSVHKNDSFVWVNDNGYCMRCARRYLYSCNSCDEWSITQGDCGCDTGWDEDFSSLLYEYDYKPSPIFYPAYDNNTRIQKTYMGFELEVEAISSIYDCVNSLDPLFNPSRRYVYFKKDGSLDNGFEVVTEPMTHDYYMVNFPWDAIGKMRSMGLRSWNSSTCGLHVHVNRDTFDGLSHTWRFCHLFNRNPDFIITLAGRSSDRWATFNGQREKVGNILLKKDRRPERYSAVNLCPENTIEIRIFKGSLKVERIKSALDLVDGAVQYTRHLTIADVNDGALSASAFIKWLISNSDKYPSVNSYIDSYYGKSDSNE